MTFLSLKHILEVEQHTTFSIGQDCSIQAYSGGDTGNLEICGQVIIQLQYHADNVAVYIIKDGFRDKGAPDKVYDIDDDIDILQEIVPERLLTLLAQYKPRRRFLRRSIRA